MRTGDVLEWLAAACFIAAAWFGTRQVWPPCLVGGGCLAYLAQCYGTHALPSLPRPKLPFRKVSQ